MNDRVKIHFKLVQDDEGYPPVSVESVWAAIGPSGSGYVLDSIPFFAQRATLGDLVSAREGEGVLWFEEVRARSRNSLVRAVLFEPARCEEIRRALGDLGCQTEWDQPHKLIAVNVPPSTPLRAVETYLDERLAAGWLDYEEPILRQ